MTTLKINDISFNYNILGTGKTGIVLISGYTGDITLWQAIAEKLAKHSQYKVLIFDPQGSGQTTDSNEPLTIESMAKNIHTLYTALNFERPFIAGFALGACVTLRIAKDFPNAIAGIISVAGTLHFSQKAQQWCEQLAKDRENGTGAAFKDAASLLYEHGFGETFQKNNPKPEFVSQLSKQLIHAQTAEGQRRQVDALKQYDARPWINELHCPHTLIISPDEDQFSPPNDCKALAQATRGKLKTIGGAGHAVLLEKPDAITACIEKFISSCSE